MKHTPTLTFLKRAIAIAMFAALAAVPATIAYQQSQPSAAKPEFGHFNVTVSFSGAVSGQKGQLKVFGVSPRDGTTPTSYYFISVRFA